MSSSRITFCNCRRRGVAVSTDSGVRTTGVLTYKSLSIWNAYNRKNVSMYYWNEVERKEVVLYQWSMLPIIGLEYEF